MYYRLYVYIICIIQYYMYTSDIYYIHILRVIYVLYTIIYYILSVYITCIIQYYMYTSNIYYIYIFYV